MERTRKQLSTPEFATLLPPKVGTEPRGLWRKEIFEFRVPLPTVNVEINTMPTHPVGNSACIPRALGARFCTCASIWSLC